MTKDIKVIILPQKKRLKAKEGENFFHFLWAPPSHSLERNRCRSCGYTSGGKAKVWKVISPRARRRQLKRA